MVNLNLQVKRLIRDCPNTRLHIVFALWGFAAPPTATDLATEMPMDRSTVNMHLHGLESDGYVFHQGQRWYLTSKGKQIPLPGLEAYLTEQSEGNSLTLSSSSSLIDTRLNDSFLLKPLPQQQQSEGNNLTLGPTYVLLIPYFRAKIGPVNDTALENALHKAADEGDDPAGIAARIEAWANYLSTEKAKGITNPGAFVARQIADAQNTPPWFSAWMVKEKGVSKYYGHDWREWLRENGYCLRCASEPCQCKPAE